MHPRVTGVEDGLHVGDIDLGVNFRVRDVLVAEDRLDVAQGTTAAKEVVPEGVPEAVARDLRQTGANTSPLELLVHEVTKAVIVLEEEPVGLSLLLVGKERTHHGEVELEDLGSVVGEECDPLGALLAVADIDEGTLGIYVGAREGGDFGAPQARGILKLRSDVEQVAAACVLEVALDIPGMESSEEGCHLGLAEDARGELLRPPYPMDMREWVVEKHARSREVGTEGMGCIDVGQDGVGLVAGAVFGCRVEEGALVGIGVLRRRLGNAPPAILHEADEARAPIPETDDAAMTPAAGGLLFDEGREERLVVRCEAEGLPRSATPGAFDDRGAAV